MCLAYCALEICDTNILSILKVQNILISRLRISVYILKLVPDTKLKPDITSHGRKHYPDKPLFSCQGKRWSPRSGARAGPSQVRPSQEARARPSTRPRTGSSQDTTLSGRMAPGLTAAESEQPARGRQYRRSGQGEGSTWGTIRRFSTRKYSRSSRPSRFSTSVGSPERSIRSSPTASRPFREPVWTS